MANAREGSMQEHDQARVGPNTVGLGWGRALLTSYGMHIIKMKGYNVSPFLSQLRVWILVQIVPTTVII